LAALLLAAAGMAAGGGGVPLIDAVKSADGSAVGQLLAKHADVNATDSEGATALHWAVYRNDLKTVDQLMQAGANPSTRNKFGMFPLSMAAESGNAAIVQRLIKGGADPNTMLRGGETPLMTAARTGNLEAVKALVRHGADVNAKESTRDQTALMWAAAQGRAPIVRFLVDAGADVHARSTELKPFHQDEYIEGRAGADSKDRLPMFTPFLFAVRGGYIEAANALLDAGANVNDVGPDKTPALHIAIINAHWQLAAALVDRGADVKVESPGGTALHQLARARGGKYMWKTPSGLPMPEATGSITAIQLAKTLLAHGADPNARITKLSNSNTERAGRQTSGLTPLMMAQIPADPELAGVLLAAGADPKLATNNHTNIVMMAAGLGLNLLFGDDEEALANLKMAVDGGLDVNAQNDDGDTALHGAAFRNSIPILQFLVEHGAKLDTKNNVGWTPLMEAHWTARGLFNTRPEAEAFLRKAYEAQGLPQIVTSREEALEKLHDSKGGPIINCPEGITVQSKEGQPTVISYPPATATTRRRYGKLETVCTPPTGSAFPVGATTVSCTAKDDNGRSDSCTVLMRVLP
jgi:ankyrin repeat protein